MNKMNKAIIILAILGLFAVMGCTAAGNNKDTNSAGANTGAFTQTVASTNNSNTQKISDIKVADNVGKIVTVSGEVVNIMQSGSVSGYKLQDSTGSIDVSSTKIPALHSNVTVTGKLRQSQYFGIVIDQTS